MAEAEEVKDVQEPAVSDVEQKLRTEYEEKFEVWKAKELAELREQDDKKIQDEVKKLFEKVAARSETAFTRRD